MFDDIEFDIKHHTIGGKLVTGTTSISLSDSKFLHGDLPVDSYIKKELCEKIVSFILENKLAEFTMQENVSDMSKTYRVRCYLAPDDQVRVLRQLNYLAQY